MKHSIASVSITGSEYLRKIDMLQAAESLGVNRELQGL
jgi:hypothetical protein